jgi:gluconolactonase
MNEGSQPSTQSGGGRDGGTSEFIASLGPLAVVSDKLTFPEGPVWSPDDSVLYFTDITADGIYKLTPPDKIEVMLMAAGHPDGLALDPHGEIVVAGYSGRSVWRLHDGKMDTMVDQVDGKKLNSPDDLIIRSDGTIYFTDPTFGLDYTKGEKSESGIEGVYRITPDGEVVLEDSSLSGPNGIALSPDETLLYVSSTFTGDIVVYDVAKDGALSNSRVWVSGALGADSMTVDANGDVFVASITGISVFSSDGTALGAISVPQLTSNVSFGGPDQRTLYITSRDFFAGFGGSGSGSGGTLYRIDDMPVAGLPGRP